MKKLIACIKSCLQAYRPDLTVVAIGAIVTCLIGSILTGDFSGTTLSLCLLLGGVSDLTGNLSACLMRCVKGNADDDSQKMVKVQI